VLILNEATVGTCPFCMDMEVLKHHATQMFFLACLRRKHWTGGVCQNLFTRLMFA